MNTSPSTEGTIDVPDLVNRANQSLASINQQSVDDWGEEGAWAWRKRMEDLSKALHDARLAYFATKLKQTTGANQTTWLSTRNAFIEQMREFQRESECETRHMLVLVDPGPPGKQIFYGEGRLGTVSLMAWLESMIIACTTREIEGAHKTYAHLLRDMAETCDEAAAILEEIA